MILLLETATLNCSVALATPEGQCVARRDEAGEGHQHAERLHVLIDEVLRETDTERSALTAVAVGRGPGSFTGLRIGTSAAKGICAGLGLPLVAPSPLLALRHLGGLTHPDLSGAPERILPAIDARRMEIFTLDAKGHPTAAVVDRGFAPQLSDGPALLIGDGAEKCAGILADHPADWRFQAAYPSAADLLPEALERLREGRAEDVADFEPFYFKDFIPGTPKDPLGLRTPSA
jgi:tRNA threonylcarbamoyladenosine biosynthesis protein TsaB